LRNLAIELFRDWPQTLSDSTSVSALHSMEGNEFEDHILASVDSNNEARNASSGILSTLCSSDPLRYLHQICAAILDSNRPDVQITSITILFSQIRSVGAFLDPHIVSQFWIARFLPAIPTILAMQSIPEHIRRVALDILIAVEIRSQSGIALGLIELLSGEPAFDSFLVNALFGMIRDSRSLCGLSLDLIRSLIGSYASNPPFLPRFSLYFATAAACPDSSSLLPLLPSVLGAIGTFETDSAIRILIDFCEDRPLFFADYFDRLLDWICSLIANRDSPARGHATHLLATLSSNAAAMCAASALFFPRSFSVLASAMTEVPDNVPLVPDPMSSDIHALAADALNSVFLALRVVDLPSPALASLEALAASLTADDPAWQQLHALLSMVAVLDPHTHTDLFEVPTVHWLASLVLSLALTPSVDLRVRAAALHTIAVFFTQSWPYAQLHFAGSFSAIVDLLSVGHPDIQFLVLNAVNTFLRHAPAPVLATLRLESLLELYANALSSDPPQRIAALLADGVGYICRPSTGADPATGLRACAGILERWVGAMAPVAVRVRALIAFCSCLPPGIPLIPEMEPFLLAAIELANPAEGHDEDLLSALTALLSQFGAAAAPQVRALLPRLFALASAEITVYAFPALTGDAIDLSLFAPAAPGTRDFVLVREAVTVIDAFRLIALCVRATALSAAIEPAVEVAVGRIRGGPPVARVEAAAWALLAELPGARAAQAALTLLLDGLRRPIESSLASATFRTVACALHSVALADEHAVAVLRVCLDAIAAVLDSMHAQVDEHFRFLDGCDEAPLRTIVGHIVPLAQVVRRLFAQNGEATAQFFRSEIEPLLPAWLALPGQRFFAIWIWREYFVATGDLARPVDFDPFIVSIISDPSEVEIKDAVFMILAEVFVLYPFEPDAACAYFQLFAEVMNSSVGLTESTAFTLDCVIISFSCLIRRNYDLLGDAVAAQLWHEAMPLTAQFEMWEEPASLLALFLELRNPVILQELEITLCRIVTTEMLSYATQETSERIVVALKEIALEMPEPFIEVCAGLRTVDERMLFTEIVDGTGLILPDIPLRDHESECEVVPEEDSLE
jgi:hypothetical protein